MTMLRPSALDPRTSDDDLLAFVLIQTWVLTTGRMLRGDVPPGRLTAEELIGFWADPAMEEPRS